MDGVLIDSEPIYIEAQKKVLSDLDICLKEDVFDRYVGISDGDMWKDIRVQYKLNASVEELIQRQSEYKMTYFEGGKLVAIEGINELLKGLANEGIRIGVASSTARYLIEFILKALNIERYFEVIVSGEEVRHGKPAPDIFLEAAKNLCTAPCDCIVIEDSRNGVKAAKASGMKCIGFRNPNSGSQNLDMADVIVDSIAQIPEVMKKYMDK